MPYPNRERPFRALTYKSPERGFSVRIGYNPIAVIEFNGK
jgi:hypothetical protein